jgi:hypothetical protein
MFITILFTKLLLQWPWFLSNMFISDPSITCYTDKNGTWICAPYHLLNMELDPEDSY